MTISTTRTHRPGPAPSRPTSAGSCSRRSTPSTPAGRSSTRPRGGRGAGREKRPRDGWLGTHRRVQLRPDGRRVRGVRPAALPARPPADHEGEVRKRVWDTFGAWVFHVAAANDGAARLQQEARGLAAAWRRNGSAATSLPRAWRRRTGRTIRPHSAPERPVPAPFFAQPALRWGRFSIYRQLHGTICPQMEDLWPKARRLAWKIDLGRTHGDRQTNTHPNPAVTDVGRAHSGSARGWNGGQPEVVRANGSLPAGRSPRSWSRTRGGGGRDMQLRPQATCNPRA